MICVCFYIVAIKLYIVNHLLQRMPNFHSMIMFMYIYFTYIMILVQNIDWYKNKNQSSSNKCRTGFISNSITLWNTNIVGFFRFVFILGLAKYILITDSNCSALLRTDSDICIWIFHFFHFKLLNSVKISISTVCSQNLNTISSYVI